MQRSHKRAKARRAGYDSHLEWELHQDVLSACDFHPEVIPYVRKSTYEPDFVYRTRKMTTLIEVKGRFRNSDEAKKYVDISLCLPNKHELIFIFADPNKPMPGARKRKDGTKRSHAEWAESHDFTYYGRDNIPKEFGK